MKRSDLAACLRLAESAALTAGHFLAAQRSAWRVMTHESGRDIKVKADGQAETLIVDLLSAASDLPIFSEETGWQAGAREAGQVWVVDPLDGSANYHQGIPGCAVSIALLEDGQPVVGVVFDFNFDELFSGLVGAGAWLNHKAITVSEVSDPGKGVLMTGFPARRDMSAQALAALAGTWGRWRKVRMIGSAALATSYVAAGRGDYYHEESTMIWDVAAGCALIKAAGGVVDISPGPLEDPRDVVGHNGKLAGVSVGNL